MTEESGETGTYNGSAFAALLVAEMARLDDEDPLPRKRWAEWLASELVDPKTGDRVVERAAVSKWLSAPRQEHLKPATYRALASQFVLPRSAFIDAVNIDCDCADEGPSLALPHFINPRVINALAKGRAFMRQASDYVVKDEGL